MSCACGCGRPVLPPKKKYATRACQFRGWVEQNPERRRYIALRSYHRRKYGLLEEELDAKLGRQRPEGYEPRWFRS